MNYFNKINSLIGEMIKMTKPKSFVEMLKSEFSNQKFPENLTKAERTKTIEKAFDNYRTTLTEKKEAPYNKNFRKLMNKYKIKSPKDLSPKNKKKFFAKVKKLNKKSS